MNLYTIEVEVVGREVYEIEAESPEEAFEIINNGESPVNVETEWDGDFEIVDEEEV